MNPFLFPKIWNVEKSFLSLQKNLMAMNELLLSLRKKYMCIHTKSIFSHHSVIILFFLMPLVAKGQYQVFDSNSANAVLEANAEYIRAYGQMTQRANIFCICF